MELWKGATIGAMLLLIAGYGVSQNRPLQGPEGGGDAMGSGTPQPTTALDPMLQQLIGKEPLPWSFPAEAWANTSKPLTKADIKGKVALLEFWRMGCSHCEEAVPFMLALKQKYGKKMEMITFQSPGVLDDPENPEISWPKVKDWMSSHGITYPVAFDEGRKLKNQYKVAFYPFILLVDKSGRIVYTHTGHTDDKAQALVTKIQALIGK